MVQSVFPPSRKVREINSGREAPCSLDGLICLYVSKLSDRNDQATVASLTDEAGGWLGWGGVRLVQFQLYKVRGGEVTNPLDLKLKLSTADRPTSNEEAKDLGKIEMIEAFSAWRHFSYGWTEPEV